MSPSGACEVKGCGRQAVCTFTDTTRKHPESRNVCRVHLDQLEKWAARKAMGECSTEGCTAQIAIRGLCRKCYDHAKNAKKLDKVAAPPKPAFESKASKKRKKKPAKAAARPKAPAALPPAEPVPELTVPAVRVNHVHRLELFVQRCSGVVVGADEAMTDLGIVLDERRLVRELLARLQPIAGDANNLLDSFSRTEG